MRARTADAGRSVCAVKLRGAGLERADHLAQRPVEYLSREHLEHAVLEREINREVDQATTLPVVAETPVVVQIFQRPVDIFDMDLVRTRLFDL